MGAHRSLLRWLGSKSCAVAAASPSVVLSIQAMDRTRALGVLDTARPKRGRGSLMTERLGTRLRLGVLSGLLGGLLLGVSPVWAEQPWLGLGLELSPQGGALIAEVYPGSSLHELLMSQKLKLGESVVALDGRPVGKPADLVALIRRQKPGQVVTLRVRSQSGQTRELAVTLLSRPSDEQMAQLSMQLEEERQKRLIGQPAPDFVVEQLHGPKLPAAALAGTLAALRGQPVVLVFFASWCGPCLREIPHLTELQARRPDVRVLALSTEESDKIRQVITRFSPGFSVARDLDRKAYGAFGVASYPTTFLIDASGVVRAVDHGSLTTVEEVLGRTPKASL